MHYYNKITNDTLTFYLTFYTLTFYSSSYVVILYLYESIFRIILNQRRNYWSSTILNSLLIYKINVGISKRFFNIFISFPPILEEFSASLFQLILLVFSHNEWICDLWASFSISNYSVCFISLSIPLVLQLSILIRLKHHSEHPTAYHK